MKFNELFEQALQKDRSDGVFTAPYGS